MSLDRSLLRQIDAQPETRKEGRSAFIRRAVRAYLDRAQRREIERAYARVYGGKADKVLAELGKLLKGQGWPAE
jgi:metal-responsive CopG/Arc/MetJ family transcriptional regulator